MPTCSRRGIRCIELPVDVKMLHAKIGKFALENEPPRDRHNRICMEGAGCWRDNAFIERLSRSVKYDEVYLHAHESLSEANVGLHRYTTRADRTLVFAEHTPDEAYFYQQPFSAGA